MRRLLVAALLAALLVMVASAAAAGSFEVRLLSQDATTITLGWDPQAGADGYRFYREGMAVSRTFDPARVSVRFGKGSDSYWVSVLHVSEGESGTYPPPPPPPPAGNMLELSGVMSAQSFVASLNAAPPGPLTVRPVAGQSSFTVTGSVVLPRPVTIQHAVIQDSIEFPEAASGSVFEDGHIWEFYIYGGDDVTIQRSVMDGRNTSCNDNRIYASPAGHTPDRWRLLGNTFRNYYCGPNPSIHTEALYIGYSNDGLISANTFEDNGTTAHIFFTYWAVGQDPATTWPRNICVTGNTFGHVLNQYYAIQGRDEIGASANIMIDPNNVFNDPQSSPNGNQKRLTDFSAAFKHTAC